MKKVIFISIAFIVNVFTQAQTPNYTANLPEVLPPSPEPATFIRANSGNVNFSTGAITASIPLYEIKMKKLGLPISMNYQSQGTRVDEIPSRIGLGWSLNCGGAITRIVKGAPDELGLKLPKPSNLNAETMQTYRYFDLLSATNPTLYDAQPDEFSFSVGPYSGKFILDSANNPVLNSHNNVKIAAYVQFENISHFILTAPDGVKYWFGNDSAYEITVSHNIFKQLHYADKTKTTFFLKKIEYLNGENIVFNYGSVSIATHQGISQSIVFSKGTIEGVNACHHCPSNGETVQTSTTTSIINYNTKYPTSIVCSNGLIVSLIYQNRPDSSNDKRVTGIDVFYDDRTIKSYRFNYYDPSNQGGSGTAPSGTSIKNSRYFLTKLYYSEIPEGDTATINHEYKFDYENIDGLPPRLSFSQDYLGFYNGKTNNNFIPANSELSTSAASADRTYDWQSAVKGVLTKITYPIGGTEEFFFEGNTIPAIEQLNTFTTEILNDIGTGAAGNTNYKLITGQQIEILRNQTAHISASSYANPSYSPPYQPGVNDYIVRAKVKDLTTQSYSFQATLYAFSSDTFSTTLTAGHTYQMELYIYGGEACAGTFLMTYDYSATDSFYHVNKANGGVRLKQIRYTDPVSKKSNSKYYKYAAIDSLTKTSGRGTIIINPIFKEDGHSIVFHQSGCTADVCGTCTCNRCSEICLQHIYSSNSMIPLNSYDGSHIYYVSIIESNDINFANGCTEFTYHNPALARTDLVVRGVLPPGIPNTNYPVFNGIKHKTRVYHKNGALLQEQQDHYGYESNIIRQVNAVYVRRRYDFFTADSAANNTVAYNDVFNPFDVITYNYQSLWLRIDSTISKNWDKDNRLLTSKTVYGYGTSVNTNTKTVTSQNSKGETIENTTLYPTDLSGSETVMSQMVSKNIIGTPVEEYSKLNGTETARKKILYKDWFSNNKVFEPEIIKLKETSNATLDSKVTFTVYDTLGNVKELAKTGGTKISYVYDYNSMLPVAEVKNAAVNQTAFTGFEADGTGGWQIVSGSAHTNYFFTGQKSFTGTISKTIGTSGTYIVTVWAKTSATVNSNSGTSLINIRGWTLYKWELSNPSTVTVAGTNIDEVRLYPKGAYMTSYSHLGYIGPQSVSDVNGQPTYYIYDAMNRLKLVRDADSSIIKQFRYAFRDTILPCTDTTADWVATGTTRCVKTTDHTNNNTGVQEREEMNFNNCSATYLQTRWVSLGVTGNCPPVSNCSAADKRVINGVCQTGTKVVTGSVNNGGTWTCTFHYIWSDGFVGPNIVETGSSPCLSGGD